MNFTANALLALGASPVMAHAREEVEEMVSIAGCLVLNIGTLSAPWIESMLLAGRKASELGIPVLLDPVGAGATGMRTSTSLRILEQVSPSVIRGNASEILALSADAMQTRGVDSSHAVADAEGHGRDLASRASATVAITGAEDMVTDGRRTFRLSNGDPMMGRITGSGCAASALTGAFLGVHDDSLEATVAALLVYGIAGEIAMSRGCPGPGSFRPMLLDALAAIEPDDIEGMAKLRVE